MKGGGATQLDLNLLHDLAYFRQYLSLLPFTAQAGTGSRLSTDTDVAGRSKARPLLTAYGAAVIARATNTLRSGNSNAALTMHASLVRGLPPASHRFQLRRLTPQVVAASAWVRPRLARTARIISPNVSVTAAVHPPVAQASLPAAVAVAPSSSPS